MHHLARMLRRLLRGAAPGPGKREGTAAKVYEISLDDLTAIRGIGTATQNRLHTAGIKSYAQLARASPEEVRMKVGKLAGGANVEDWIAQAQELNKRQNN